MASNARKRAALPQVKARMAELAAPAQQKAEHEIAMTVGAAEDKLWQIATVDLGKQAVKVPDQIAAIKTLAQLRGWNAPEKTALTNTEGTGPVTYVVHYTREPIPQKTDSA